MIITSARETGQFGGLAVAFEDLDENPGVFKGQLLSKLNEGDDVVLVGVDPGTRIGLAVFYGETNLEYSTFGSVAGTQPQSRGIRTRRACEKVRD